MAKITRYRSSITWKFVKKEYAEKHPKTTEKEKIKVQDK